MPHQCTNCNLTFEDGSKQMLGGCPECGGNKFQFLPNGKTAGPGTDDEEADVGEAEVASTSSTSSPPAATSSTPSTAESSTPSTPDPSPPRTTTASIGSTVTEGSPAGRTGSDDNIEAPAEPVDSIPDGEDRAQASARRDVVSEDELPAAEPGGRTEEAAEPDPSESEDDRPDLAQLRQELNDQFESIKILQPGEYELNLMELYDRQEYIIAVEEDGRYVIDVPDSWRDDD